MFRLAKTREKVVPGFTETKQINNEHIIMGTTKERWKGYFDKILNEKNTWSDLEDGVHNEGLTPRISAELVDKNEEGKCEVTEGDSGGIR